MNGTVNKNLAMLLENSEIDALHSRLSAIQEIQGNPMGVEIKKIGNAFCYSCKNIPGPAFNTVKGLNSEDAGHVDEILEFYRQKEIPVRFELTPAHASTELLHQLHRLGFYQNDFHTTLYMPITELSAPVEDSISIRKMKMHEASTYADIYVQGFQMPAFLKDGVAQNNEVLFDHDQWTFYLATVEGEPAGIGAVFIKDHIATLAAAATLPSSRNRGIQSGLIQQRIYQAYREECSLVVGQAKFGSVSQNNMERAGMRIGYTKAIWMKG
ncbi:GNAT superfamily N-acetyltransferase [Bacillus tianshenii]|uniref:GNAT superfamily N-acetyltransferase n=1 Tax=Sutcliffiella tianshenii TaxID=1463404 RepID=A0ABS2P256_9BACI|nr:GNAT family N-acetyltransferase [Bacillus tianshenii]MBM7621044.1 GNAT superfamily N-acetyltransferase [Bacillus tianshenii]